MRMIDSLVSIFLLPFSPADKHTSCSAMPHIRPFLPLLLMGLLPALLHSQETEIGWANYYADSNQGKQTAYGEIYDRNQFTCSHPEYPVGTLLRITRLDNQNTVVVRVNDKGPHTEGFLVTLSMGAATAIHMATPGKARVLVEPIELKPSNPITSYDYNPDANYTGSKGAQPSTYSQIPNESYPSPAPNQSYYGQQTPGFSWNTESGLSAKSPQAYENTNQPVVTSPVYYTGFTVQLGAFANPANAEHQLEIIRNMGVNNVSMRSPGAGSSALYKILAGSFSTRSEAEAFKKSLLQKFQLPGFIVEL